MMSDSVQEQPEAKHKRKFVRGVGGSKFASIYIRALLSSPEWLLYSTSNHFASTGPCKNQLLIFVSITQKFLDISPIFNPPERIAIDQPSNDANRYPGPRPRARPWAIQLPSPTTSATCGKSLSWSDVDVTYKARLPTA